MIHSEDFCLFLFSNCNPTIREEMIYGMCYCCGGGYISDRQIAYEKVDLDAVYDIGDGWLNQRFRFSGITTNLQEEGIAVIIDVKMPHMYYANRQKKDLTKAKKVSEAVKYKINEDCNRAIWDYKNCEVEYGKEME